MSRIYSIYKVSCLLNSYLALMALTQMGWKVLVRVVSDLIAWDNARLADQERQLRRQQVAQVPPGAVLEGTFIPPQRGSSSYERPAVVLGVELIAAVRVLRNRRFDVQAIVIIFALAALSQLGWEELVRAVRDLIAWDKTRMADLDKKAASSTQSSPGPVMPRIRA